MIKFIINKNKLVSFYFAMKKMIGFCWDLNLRPINLEGSILTLPMLIASICHQILSFCNIFFSQIIVYLSIFYHFIAIPKNSADKPINSIQCCDHGRCLIFREVFSLEI